jgi:hypothetical protein
MLKGFKSTASVTYRCDMCGREVMTYISLVEGDELEEFKQQVIDTMNAEGASIAGTWVCPDCVRE